jgi:hypothetical protein
LARGRRGKHESRHGKFDREDHMSRKFWKVEGVIIWDFESKEFYNWGEGRSF